MVDTRRVVNAGVVTGNTGAVDVGVVGSGVNRGVVDVEVVDTGVGYGKGEGSDDRQPFLKKGASASSFSADFLVRLDEVRGRGGAGSTFLHRCLVTSSGFAVERLHGGSQTKKP